jgi:glycosyltransferase involved in cell wall biosynthesis
MSTPRLCVICPVYNEQASVPVFYARMAEVSRQLASRCQTRVLFMDNCSDDGTWDAIAGIRARDESVDVIRLTKNFGYQASVECGLTQAQADLFVVIDVDCEDPPEMIPQFLDHIERGCDIVYGERTNRMENAAMVVVRKAFYRLTKAIADEPFVNDMAEFCMMTAAVRDAIIQECNSYPFIRSSVGRVGFQRVGLPYKRQERVAGRTHYNFVNMVVFGVAGILTASTFPLRLAAYLFPFWLLALMAFGIGAAMSSDSATAWFVVLVVTGMAFPGFVLVCISMYVARIYKNGLQRPNYVIDRKRSFFPGR